MEKMFRIIVILKVIAGMIALGCLLYFAVIKSGFLSEEVVGNKILGIDKGTQHNLESVSGKTIGIVKKMCEKRGWNWANVSTFGQQGNLSVSYPSSYGGDANRFEVNGDTGHIMFESIVTGSGSTIAKFYDKKGKLQFEIPYEGTLRSGKHRSYGPGGVLEAEIPYVNGQKHGVAKRFDEHGDLEKKVLWEKGAFVKDQRFSEGKPLSSERGCKSNLLNIDGAKQVWALVAVKGPEVTPTWDDLVPNYLLYKLKCREDGIYTIGKVGEAPLCTVEGHNIE